MIQVWTYLSAMFIVKKKRNQKLGFEWQLMDFAFRTPIPPPLPIDIHIELFQLSNQTNPFRT